jgi:hypothetical protein
MNVEIGAEAAQFPEKEYINGIAVAVWLTMSSFDQRCEVGMWLLWQEFARRTNIGVAVLEPHLDSETVTPLLTHSINRTESIRPTNIFMSNLKRTYI